MPNEDGRISTDQEANNKNQLKSFNFELKIIEKLIELNSSIVSREAEKEFGDLTGFKQLKLINLKSPNDLHKNADKIWIANFEMHMQTDADTNETEYLAYLQNSLNETVINGHIGNLMLDTSHYAQLKGN